MKVKFSLYEIPLPGVHAETSRPQARVQSKGTIRLEEICSELRELGVNSAQIKAVLDATAKYMGKALVNGYNFELEGIGSFSLSLHSTLVETEKGESVQVEAHGVNFRYSPSLKEKINEAQFELIKQSPVHASLTKRKRQMIGYIETYGYINISKYALLNNCSRYQATKDIEYFEKEGLITSSGMKTHKVYVLL
ncbi:DNA-binding protein [Parabacteroides sp. 52]|uniref:HU family DNA-binding protein n=1 Tax=unclassified Parabacteroides TaxID=2649774 RepID=UPI0013D13B77|nr:MULTISPECIES: HU family DNA-binding protein [unclassified Parabacteroides]MDH6535257.1 putative histone-like DNA-binding protein [Parabacteroides sp. PM5-20]NDV55820.1 DNA-binding protein [Parabacteroides sp. 52]